MIKDLLYFDSCAISSKKIPLPFDENEEIKIFYSDVYFRFESKDSRESLSSLSGSLYLTTYRVIYISNDYNTTFKSFFVPLNKIFSVESDYYIECLCEHSYVGTIYLSFKNNYNKTFFEELVLLLEKIALEIDPSYLETEKDDELYYSDIYEAC